MSSARKIVEIYLLPLAVLTCAPLMPIELLRTCTALVFAITIGREVLLGRGLFVRSPAFLLALATNLAFVTVPLILTATIAEGRFFLTDGSLAQNSPVSLAVQAYFGSGAEYFIHWFTVWLLLIHLVIISRVSAEKSAPAPASTSLLLAILGMAAGILVGTALCWVLVGPESSLTQRVIANFPVVQGVILIYAICRLPGLQHRRLATIASLLVLWSLSIAIVVVTSTPKVAFFLLVAGIAAFISSRSITPLLVGKIIGAGTLAILLISPGWEVASNGILSLNGMPRLSERIVYAVMHKLVQRQVETGYCLSNVIEKHKDTPFALGDQFYWLPVFVPRALWPDKPNFSLGHQYAIPYCGFVKMLPNQSSAITVLGQPIIHGGILGGFMGIGILALVIGGLTWLGYARGGMFAAPILATSPWWLDFEQDFSLYLGNLGKNGIVAAVVFGAVIILSKYIKPTKPSIDNIP